MKVPLTSALLSFTWAATLVVGTSFADDTQTKRPDRVEPLILELKLEAGAPLRQEVLVSEGRSFRVITHRQHERWLVAGDVKSLVDGVAVINLKVSMHGPHPGSSVDFGPMEIKQRVGKFNGGGFGVSGGIPSVSDLWIRRGTDPIPSLTKQLSADPESAVAAAQHLGQLGAAAKAALPALTKAAGSENDLLERAARTAISHIQEQLGAGGK